MKTKNLFILFALCTLSFSAFCQSNSVPIGKWRDHLSYYFTHNVFLNNKGALVACESALFYYNRSTGEMKRFSKIDGLSDAGLGVCAYDTNTGTLIVTYENSNIDIVRNGKIYNIPDIKNRSIEGSKSINSIFFDNKKAYLACGFGIVVLDIDRHEIYDTWYLGENSSKIRINCVYIDDTAIYAGTVDGLLYADKYSRALMASSTWHKKNITSETNKEINYIVPFDSKHIFINILDSASSLSTLVKYDGNTVDTVQGGEYIVGMKNCNGKIGIINYQSFNVYDSNMTQLLHISDTWNPIANISCDIIDFDFNDKELCLAHRNSGLVYFPDYMRKTSLTCKDVDCRIVFPNGPMTNDAFSMTSTPSGKIYLAPGGKDATNAGKFIRADAYIYNGYDYWYDLEYKDDNDTIYDALNVAIDPRDETHIMISTWSKGIIEAKNDTIVNIYDYTNTDGKLENPSYNYRIASVQYDASGNLLIANSLADHAFAYLNYHGVWGNMLTNGFLPSDDLKGMCLDKTNFYKILYTATNKILIINNDEQMLYVNVNNGSKLETSSINCMEQDKNGEIWIGTEKGIKVIYSLNNAFSDASALSSNVECNNIVYDEQGIAQYLLSFENVTCIMVDGANRKWVGTERSGIYVLSESGDKEIAHFTMENSPLISNRIICMTQSPISGEVFIGTDRGIVSYRAQSLEPKEKAGTLTTFPNPIRPEYNGMISIEGFVRDSDVRITDARGRMVAHLKSLGGRAVWDGKNFSGQRVGSGVYYIFSSAKEGDEKSDGKLIFIN